jgi:uncharacterized membrane protein
MSDPRKFFTPEEQAEIVAAIGKAELKTSGEIRLHMEAKCKENVLDHAAHIFKTLEMHKTQLRNGVLFYLAIDDRKFAILGDAGINAMVPANFWDEIKENMLAAFKMGNYKQGLIDGILKAGKQLKAFFPYQENDINELPDDISFGSKN